MLGVRAYIRVIGGGVELFCCCVLRICCVPVSFRLLCIEYERNGWRGKSCERVGSFFMICHCSRRMRESGGRSVL